MTILFLECSHFFNKYFVLRMFSIFLTVDGAYPQTPTQVKFSDPNFLWETIIRPTILSPNLVCYNKADRF